MGASRALCVSYYILCCNSFHCPSTFLPAIRTNTLGGSYPSRHDLHYRGYFQVQKTVRTIWRETSIMKIPREAGILNPSVLSKTHGWKQYIHVLYTIRKCCGYIVPFTTPIALLTHIQDFFKAFQLQKDFQTKHLTRSCYVPASASDSCPLTTPRLRSALLGDVKKDIPFCRRGRVQWMTLEAEQVSDHHDSRSKWSSWNVRNLQPTLYASQLDIPKFRSSHMSRLDRLCGDGDYLSIPFGDWQNAWTWMKYSPWSISR